MRAFNGIINDCGCESRFTIYIDLDKSEPYETDFFSGEYYEKIKISITKNRLVFKIQGTTFDVIATKKDDELFIIGKENRSCIYSIMCCVFPPKFFVGSNKEEV